MVPQDFAMDRFIVISGCSGGGKSTLVAELARRGYASVEEPGRRIVEDEKRAPELRSPGSTWPHSPGGRS
jgi:predicted ATPase